MACARRIALLVVSTCLVLAFTCASAVAAVDRPSDFGIAWGPAGPRVAVPGPPIVSPPNSYFPPFDGTGYSIYVCRAARAAGYTSGHLNNAFDFVTNVHDTVPGNGAGAQYGSGPGQFPTVSAFTSGFNASDSCNNWHSGSDGGLLVRHLPGQPFVKVDRNVRLSYQLDLPPSAVIKHIDFDADVTKYKTKGNVGDGDVGVLGSDVFMLMARSAAPSTATPNPFTMSLSSFRTCSAIGRWDVPVPSADGAYPAAQGWRDGDRHFIQDLPEWPYDPTVAGFLGMIHVWPFYKAGATGAAQPWHPYFQTGPAAGNTHANPNAICNLSGGPSGVFFRPQFGPHSIMLYWECHQPNGSTHQGCRGETGISPEPANARPNTGHDFMYLRSMRVFVSDTKPPTVNLDPGGMNAGGAIIGSGNDNATLETLTWKPMDESGIRSVQVRLNGVLKMDVALPCDHRYRVPCPYATGLDIKYEPPRPASGLPDSWAYDIDPLPRGLYNVDVSVQDGAGIWATERVSFRNDTPLPQDDCNAGGSTPLGSVAGTLVARTGVYGSDIVETEANICDGSSFADPVPGAPGVTPNAPGALVAAPITGDGIFSYTLAANQRPASVPLNPADCIMRDLVISGAAGGALGRVERNQIVSVTIDLRSFVKTKGSVDRGGQLGEHVLKSTYDLPTRATQRFRAALGCPS